MQGIAEPAVIVMEGSFHGRTLATLAATRAPAEGRCELTTCKLKTAGDNRSAWKNDEMRIDIA